jgi:hypothetical protein
MADQTYDDTNRGAAFTPFPTQSLILKGKVNVDGVDKKVLLVKDTTKDGKNIVEMYEKIGVLFENDKKGNDSAPDYSGPMGDTKRIAGWKKMKDDRPYMSFQISDKTQGGGAAPQSPLSDDTIPF